MNKHLLACLFYLACCVSPVAGQILVKGDTLQLYTTLDLPTDTLRHARLERRLDSLKIATKTDTARYTLLWRIGKDSLRLEKIYEGVAPHRWLPTEDIYATGTAAAWFSGEVRAVRPDKVIFRTNTPSSATFYQYEIHYTIDKGRIVATKKFHNDVIGSQKTFQEKTLPAIAKAYVFPQSPSSAELRSLFIAFAATPNKRGVIQRFDLVRMVLYKQDGTTERLEDPLHPFAQALLNELIQAEPYAVTLYDKIRPITGGVTVTPPKEPTPPPPTENTEAQTPATTEGPPTDTAPVAIPDPQVPEAAVASPDTSITDPSAGATEGKM